MRVRVVRCHACGGPKLLPSPTAFIYCDYCGALADWDFGAACSQGNALPGPAYESLRARLDPQIRVAVQYRDFARCKALYGELFSHHIYYCPSSYSPRIVDPSYRGRYLDYFTDLMTLRELEPTVVQHTAWLDQRIRELRQAQGMQVPGLVFGPFRFALLPQISTTFPDQPFWNVYTAFRGQQRVQLQAAQAAGALAKYPDDVTVDVLERIGISTFVQGWLPFISQAAQSALIADAKLGSTYVDVSPPPVQLRRCGGCGETMNVVTGARNVICFRCGQKVDVQGAEFPCPGCGGTSSIPTGATVHVCPYCQLRTEKAFSLQG